MMAGASHIELDAVAEAYSGIVKQMKRFEPFRLASTFATLLTSPEHQGNCVRLELLVLLALAFGRGQRQPSASFIKDCFSAPGRGRVGATEDPSEDVFVSSVSTPRGNFRILEGTWESAGFQLQRFMNAIEEMPRGTGYDELREAVYALLPLSDAVCERASLTRGQSGNERPATSVSWELVRRSNTDDNLTIFSEAELAELGISIEHLARFSPALVRNRQRLCDKQCNPEGSR